MEPSPRMKVLASDGPGEEGKFRALVRTFPEVWRGAVLDVGSRLGALRGALGSASVRYVGLDLNYRPSVIGDIEHAPFPARAFDAVVALDVLEHTNDIYGALREVFRLARTYVVVVLPNCYEARLRVRFALGRPISGKYGLPTEPMLDRHRWLFSLPEARRFVRENAVKHGFGVTAERSLVGSKSLSRVQYYLAAVMPNLFAVSYLAVLERSRRLEK